MYDQGPPPIQNNQPAAPASEPGVGNPMQWKSQIPPTPEQILKTQRTIPIIPLVLAIVVIAIIGVAFIFFKGYLIKASTTTSSTTIQSSVSQISNCRVIARPGYYFVSSNIKTAIGGGACINVSSSNVNIACNGNKVSGSGPFVVVPPFTYGISIINKTNITVSGCNVRNFSYGIFVESSNNINVVNDNLSINYVANLYLNNTHNSTVMNNYLSRASSAQGSIFLTNGTSGINVSNNIIQYNQYFGINVNTSNITFARNFLNGTQYSFRCSVPNGFVTSSKAYSNICYNSTGCGFVECRGINIPTNISKLTLQSSVVSCGSIVQPGTYVLMSNISMQNFVNISNILSLLTPCIRVASKNVLLNCRGFSINNSTIAISALDKQNITIENCKINSAAIGILLSNTSISHVSNITLRNQNYGIDVINSSLTTFSNIIATADTYGISLSSSFSNVFQNINLLHNTYGLYLQSGSFSNSFNKGIVSNSSKIDVFATADSANASYNLMLSVNCNYTNAVWATCKHFISPSLPYVPLTNCSTINAPGNYILTSSIVNAQNKCLQIKSNDVSLNCANHIISSGSSSIGLGLLISNSRNVTVNQCNFVNFPAAVNVSGSSAILINKVNVQNSNYGITLNGVVNGSISNSTINDTTNASIMLYHTYASRLFRNIINYGQSHNVGILINNSQNNTITNNSGSRNNVGMQLTGNSINNTIMNNTMQLNTNFDYMCVGNGALNSENGGVNYGTTESKCRWLAAITPTAPTIECSVATQPSLFTLTQDYKYPSGSICFSSFANTTTINCNGHTVIATNGGTFASFINSQGSNIENCFLKGFTDTIIASNSSITVFNNTILENSAHGTAIQVSNSRFGANVKENNVTASYFGISLSNIGGGTLQNNYVSRANTAYFLSNVTALTVKNNTASNNTYTGLVVNDSVANIFLNNNFVSATTGISCLYTSQGAFNNSDSGANRCTLNQNCFWIKSSLAQCP